MMNVSKSIIEHFFNAKMSRNVRLVFEKWILDKRNRKDKDEALKELFYSFEPKSILHSDISDYNRKLYMLHESMNKSDNKKKFIKRIIYWSAAAAFLLLALIPVEYLIIKKWASTSEETICMITSKDSKGRFTLPDGSVVWLNADSKLTYNSEFKNNSNRYVKLNGEAYFDVKHFDSSQFVVDMGGFDVKVLGTQFMVNNRPYNNIKEVVLKSGKVEISKKNTEQKFILEPNQNFMYNRTSNRISVGNVEADNYCNWIQKSVVLDCARLSDVLINIEHKYNISFMKTDEIDSSTRLSITLCHDDLEETLNVIEMLSPVCFIKVDESHYLVQNLKND